MRRHPRASLTLIELILVLAIGAILFVVVPPLAFHGIKTLTYVPKSIAVNRVATEVMHEMIEGGFSEASGLTVALAAAGGEYYYGAHAIPLQGLRSASAIWYASPTAIGYRASKSQYVYLRLEDGVIKRSVMTAPSCSPTPNATEVVPYDAPSGVRITTNSGPLFRYYTHSGVEVAPGCPLSATVGRVDLHFVAQTGGGSFDQGDAREEMMSSLAVRSQ